MSDTLFMLVFQDSARASRKKDCKDMKEGLVTKPGLQNFWILSR